MPIPAVFQAKPAADWGSLLWTNQTDARDAVVIYSRVGLHPILIHGILPDGTCTCGAGVHDSAGKHPVSKGWQFAPLDLGAMDRQLLRQPFLNVGLRMGKQADGSFLVCFDVDGDLSLLAPLEQDGDKFPRTLKAKTARGHHLIYKWPDGPPKPKNRVRLVDGVDLRAAGGQIVVAPSRHVSGARYRWIDAVQPEALT